MTPADWEAIGVTPEAILYCMTWGMGVVLFMWSLGFAVGAAISVIRKA